MDEHYHYTYVIDDPEYIDYKFLDPKAQKPKGYKNVTTTETKKSLESKKA